MSTVTAQIFGASREARPRPGTSAPWPAPLGPAAYIGVLGDIVQEQAPETEADPAGILLSLLVMLGNVIGRRACFRVGADLHFLTLYLAVVGQSSRGRKGVGLGLARALIAPIDESWTERCQASGLNSGEGLIHAVRDTVTTQKPTKERGVITGYEDVIADPGVEDKRLLVVETELGSVLRRMAREANSLSAILRDAWDGRNLRNLTKATPETATAPHISIVSHITKAELGRYLDGTEQDNGFGNRFLWCCVRRQRELPEGGAPIVLDAYRERLADVLQWCAFAERELIRDADASALWHRAYHRLTTERPGLLGKVTSRAEAQVMRLASLYAVSERTEDIGGRHLRAALEVWRYVEQSAGVIFGDSLGDPVADTLLAELKRVYPASVTRKEISDLFGRHRTAAEITRAVSLLVDAGLAETETDRSGIGRPQERVVFRECELSEESEESQHVAHFDDRGLRGHAK